MKRASAAPGWGSGGYPPGRHSPHEEDPVAFSAELVNWLKDPEPDR